MQHPTEYAVVIEPTATGYGVYVPDLPGCVSAGTSREEAMTMITEAIEMHIESLREHARRSGDRARGLTSRVQHQGVAASNTLSPGRAASRT